MTNEARSFVMNAKNSGRGCLNGTLGSEFPSIAATWDTEANGSLTPFDVSPRSGKEVYWKCKQGHVYKATVNNRHRQGCSYCGNRKFLAGFNDVASKYPELLPLWHPTANLPLLPHQAHAVASIKYAWTCKHGHLYYNAATVMAKLTQPCPYCAHREVLPGFNDLATICPEVAAEWHPTKNLPLTPQTVLPSTTQTIVWVCSRGHEYTAQLNQRVLQGKPKSGCPYCAHQKVLPGFNDIATTHPWLIEEWDESNEFMPQEVMGASDKIITWKCSKCGNKWKSPPKTRTRQNCGCPACSPSVSIPERCTTYYLKPFFPDMKTSYHHPLVPNKEMDVYLPSIRAVLEYDGERFHQDVEKDMEKSRLFNEAGFVVIRFREAGCPVLPNDDICIHVPTDKYRGDYGYMTQPIKELFMVLQEKFAPIEKPTIDVANDMYRIITYSKTVDAEKSLATQYPDVLKDWDPTNVINPALISARSGLKASWICHKCGYQYLSSISNRVRYQDSCACCSHKVLVSGKNDFATEAPDAIKYWDEAQNGYPASQAAMNYRQRCHFKCPDCGFEWTSTTSAVAKRQYKCVRCASRSTRHKLTEKSSNSVILTTDGEKCALLSAQNGHFIVCFEDGVIANCSEEQWRNRTLSRTQATTAKQEVSTYIAKKFSHLGRPVCFKNGSNGIIVKYDDASNIGVLIDGQVYKTSNASIQRGYVPRNLISV